MLKLNTLQATQFTDAPSIDLVGMVAKYRELNEAASRAIGNIKWLKLNTHAVSNEEVEALARDYILDTLRRNNDAQKIYNV